MPSSSASLSATSLPMSFRMPAASLSREPATAVAEALMDENQPPIPPSSSSLDVGVGVAVADVEEASSSSPLTKFVMKSWPRVDVLKRTMWYSSSVPGSLPASRATRARAKAAMEKMSGKPTENFMVTAGPSWLGDE